MLSQDSFSFIKSIKFVCQENKRIEKVQNNAGHTFSPRGKQINERTIDVIKQIISIISIKYHILYMYIYKFINAQLTLKT